jgi:hypothetical protein
MDQTEEEVGDTIIITHLKYLSANMFMLKVIGSPFSDRLLITNLRILSQKQPTLNITWGIQFPYVFKQHTERK